MLYSLNNAYPTELPDRIRMPDGSTRTDKSTFTDEEISSTGYVEVRLSPPHRTDMEKVIWDYSAGDWVIVPLTEQEIQNALNYRWANIREERDLLLATTDHIVLMHYELGEPVPEDVKQYRQALRDLPQTYDDINSIEWPARLGAEANENV